MSENEGNNNDKVAVDQITAVPKETHMVSTKVKDPKRVAAGKALAERNRKAREALKEKEAAKANDGTDVKDDSSQFSIDNVVKAAALVGAGFTLYHGYAVIKSYLTKPAPTKTVRSPLKETVSAVKEEPEKRKVKENEIEME